MPTEYQVAAVIPFGFPGEEPAGHASENLDERLHFDVWRSAAG